MSRRRPPAEPACPCGSGAPLVACCGRFLEVKADAPDAERLMRSRYSAFVGERGDYLLATWHASRRPPAIDFDTGAKWLGLEVRRHQSTGPDSAEVEFVARWRVGGRAVRLHECSRFVRESGRWFYVDGDDLTVGGESD